MHDYLRLTLPAEQLERALRSWSWLGVDRLRPRASTMFGDLILDGRDGWWFLSTIQGTLDRPWATQQECEAELNTEDGMQDYLGAGLVDLARRADLRLQHDEVIGFAVPPLFGAGFDLDNLRPTKFAVVHLLMGQVHAHTREQAMGGAVPVPEGYLPHG